MIDVEQEEARDWAGSDRRGQLGGTSRVGPYGREPGGERMEGLRCRPKPQCWGW